MRTKYLLRVLPKNIRPYQIQNLTSVFATDISRNSVYQKMKDFYYAHLPLNLVRHRNYFNNNKRGFGENPFHSMWYLLFSEFKPVNCLEIGVYRGQVLTLWSMLARHFNYACKVAGVSPFSTAGDEVSKYIDVDYLADTIMNHEHFKLNKPDLCVDFSNGAKARNFISSRKWDLIYIDGSHDVDIVQSDFDLCLQNLADNGIIVMDDSSLYFDYEARDGSFAGHPGPSKIAKEIAQFKLNLIGGVGHNNIFKGRRT